MTMFVEKARQDINYITWLMENPAEAEGNLLGLLREAAYKLLQTIEDASNAQLEPHTPAGSKLYPRKCDTCGEGMQEGYLGSDGGTWCSDKCLFADGYTPEQYAIDYENDDCFWTDWEWNNGWGEQWTKDGTCYLWHEATDTWKQEKA